jgi:hypothetical protein
MDWEILLNPGLPAIVALVPMTTTIAYIYTVIDDWGWCQTQPDLIGIWLDRLPRNPTITACVDTRESSTTYWGGLIADLDDV